MEIQHFSHPHHNLKLVDSIKVSGVPNCNCCDEVMTFPGYACESEKCKFYLHKSCAELAQKISHPLHPHPHPLILHTEIPRSKSSNNVFLAPWEKRYNKYIGIICDGCRNLYNKGFTYYCSWCRFNLHPKCASKQDHQELLQQQTFEQLTHYHFYHKQHALNFCNLRYSNKKYCCCCKKIISGSAYCCLECGFFIHESCKEIPVEVQHPFHPQHILLTQAVDVQNKLISGRYRNKICCNACKSSIGGIKIGCNKCAFQLHVSCANPSRYACALRNDSHQHNMYYFVDDYTTGSFECNKCHEKCLEECFYRCVECDFNLHLKCIPVPSVVMITQKHHHPLTLIDSVKEDNPLIQYLMDSTDKVDYLMNYYCDDCETPGNPKHHAYYCKECVYIAHVDCIISKFYQGDNSLEIQSNLNPTDGTEPKEEQKNTSDKGKFHPAELECSTTEFQASQTMSKSDTSMEIPSNLNPTHGTEPKKEQKNTSDEGEFHPAELECSTTELQAAQTLSKNDDTSLEIPSNLNPSDVTEPKKEQKNTSDEGEFHPARLELLQAAQTMSKSDTSLEIPLNLNPTHGTEPKKEQENTSDEGEFHPAELECSTIELQAAQTLSKDDTSLEIPSNLNPTHGTKPKKEHKILSDEADLDPAESSNLKPTYGTEPEKEHKILSDEEDLDPAESDRTTEHVAQNMSEDKSDQVKEADHPEKEHKSDIVEDQNKAADQIDKRMTSIIVKMKALGSELEDLVKYDTTIENIRANMEALTSEVEAATKHV